VSALTWNDQDSHAGELFFKGDVARNIFVKGYLGIGSNDGGKLIDEDFPPLTVPYSRTSSSQTDGSFRYFNVDLGYTFYDSGSWVGGYKDAIYNPGVKLSALIGYHYLNDQFGAVGCTQLAANPDICGYGPAGMLSKTSSPGYFPGNLQVHSEDIEWNSLRIGLAGEVAITNRLKFSAEAAYLPYVSLSATDHHQLRPEINPLPQDGTGDGVQVEGVLTYQLTHNFDVGVGGRWWHYDTDSGKSHFEQTVGGGIAQGTKFHEDRAGVFVQGSLKFDNPMGPMN
jgi:hypothetical protein